MYPKHPKVVWKHEKIALKWLRENGYYKKTIKYQSSGTPDFRCSDGKGFEVKRLLHGHRIVFGFKQINSLDNCDIIVVDEEKNEVVAVFPSEALHEQNFEVVINKPIESKKTKSVSEYLGKHKKDNTYFFKLRNHFDGAED